MFLSAIAHDLPHASRCGTARDDDVQCTPRRRTMRNTMGTFEEISPLAASAAWTQARRRMKWTIRFAWSGWVVCLLAWGLIFHQVESVLFSCPVILFCGFGGMWLARHVRHRGALWLGAANCGICLLFIGLVNLLHWSPRHADRPFRIMGAAYVLATLPVAILVSRAAPALLHRNLAQLGGLVCEQCGYDLRGQIDPRCPECGRPFDPQRLAGHGTISPASTTTLPSP